MPSFADSFWSADYAGGLGVLFGKLQQGIVENEQLLTTARIRAEAEEQYGRRLADVQSTTDRMSGGFQRDDGASLKKAYDGVRTEMAEASKNHAKIAANINELVVLPFSRWCAAHESRVMSSHDDLQGRIKAHDKQAELVQKLRSAYFNKCRQLEDLEEEGKLAFQPPQKAESSPKSKAPQIKLPDNEQPDGPEPVDIGDETYDVDRLKALLTDMLTSVPIGETKVAILGTYSNVSSGSDIVDYMQKNLGATSVSYAERMGQDLVGLGFLRLVGNVGSTFANSSRMYYQWRPKAYQLTGVQEKKKLERISSMGSDLDSPVMASVGDMLQGYNLNPFNNPYPNETPGDRMKRESAAADEKYKQAVRKLDSLRCNLEEAIVENLKFMERCELDRLKALKAVILDFSGALSNVIPSLQSTIDNMMLYQEAVQPAADLRYLLENYKTGTFFPKVQVYDNYYNSVEGQTFGVDIEARARQDRKRVPLLITTILTFLDSHYPDLEGDEARRVIWTVDVPLAATHHLRAQINNGQAPPHEILERYEIPIVASVLKLYLLELPDSLVSSQVYEVIKTIYSTPDSTSSPSARVAVLQNTLGQLRLANIATLDAITTHFTRLVELTSADEAYISSLAQTLAPCILRPRVENTLTMQERHGQRLVRDLFDHKDEIFGELKRASVATHGASTARGRPSISTPDESNRRANMEARTKAIVSRSRATSPAPAHIDSVGANARHRRDRSVGDPAARFPVVASPTVSRDHVHRRGRYSLDVPDADPSTPPSASHAHAGYDGASGAAQITPLRVKPGRSDTNGSLSAADAAAAAAGIAATAHSATSSTSVDDQSYVPPRGSSLDDPASTGGSVGVEKKNSLTRQPIAHRTSRKGTFSSTSSGLALNSRSSTTDRDSVGSMPAEPNEAERDANANGQAQGQDASYGHQQAQRGAHGVQLVDQPMDF